MGSKLNLSEKLDFSTVDLTSPPTVIANLTKEIAEQTHGMVEGILAPYDGQIFSYTTQSFSTALLDALGTVDTKVDIQTTLGKSGDETKKYVFYINTPIYEKYKYKLFYLQHGISNYPAKLVLEQSIADDVFAKSNANYIVSCDSSTELEQLLIRILLSKKIIGVMQELIRINQAHRVDEETLESPTDIEK